MPVTSPISPLATMWSISANTCEPKVWKPTWHLRPVSSTMATRLSNSASDTVVGFSSRTSQPARRAVSASGRWVGSGVLSTTTSGVLSCLASSSSSEEYRGASDDAASRASAAVSYTHLRAHETRHDLVCRLLLEKKKKKKCNPDKNH